MQIQTYKVTQGHVQNLNIRKRLKNRYKDDVRMDCRYLGCEDVKKIYLPVFFSLNYLMKYKWKYCIHLFLVFYRHTVLGSC
jgi:hypothetical protein